MKKILNEIKKPTLILLLFILGLAAFMRLYKIGDYMTFLGDEGRDALIVKGILEGDIVFLGPRASAGDFFTGPIYYYFMAPFLWLFNLDPVGPAVMVALFGIATVLLVYYVGKRLFGETAGLTGAALYAVSPVVIAYSRSSWNPNPVPFFSILALFLIYLSIKKFSWKKYVAAGILFGITMQLHYQAFFLGGVIVVFVLAGNYVEQRKKWLKKSILAYTHLAVGFVVGISPFLAFEARHGFPNTITIVRFIAFGAGDPKTIPEEIKFWQIVWDVFYRIFGRLLTRYPPPEQVNPAINSDIFVWYFGTIILAIISIFFLFKTHDRLTKVFFLSWLIVGVGIFGFYRKPIYDYYFGFMFTLPFLLVGNTISSLASLKKQKQIGMILAGIIFLTLMVFNLQGSPFRNSPNQQKEQVRKISEFVLSKTDGKPFNFALITLGNSDHSYRYFFELEDRSPVAIENEMIDPERKTVTDQLLIICEDQSCQPLGNSLWEVAGFGQAEIVGEWQLTFVKVYKLKHLNP